MSRNDLIDAYRTGRVSRRTFIRGMMALGVSATVAVSLADTVRATPSGGNLSRWVAIEDAYGGDDTYDDPGDDDDTGGEDPGGEDPGDGTGPDDDDPGSGPGDDDGGDDTGGDDDDDEDPGDDDTDDDDKTPNTPSGADDDDDDDDDEVAGTKQLPSTGSGLAGARQSVRNTLIGLAAATAGIAVRLRRNLPVGRED